MAGGDFPSLGRYVRLAGPATGRCRRVAAAVNRGRDAQRTDGMVQLFFFFAPFASSRLFSQAFKDARIAPNLRVYLTLPHSRAIFRFECAEFTHKGRSNLALDSLLDVRCRLAARNT